MYEKRNERDEDNERDGRQYIVSSLLLTDDAALDADSEESIQCRRAYGRIKLKVNVNKS